MSAIFFPVTDTRNTCLGFGRSGRQRSFYKFGLVVVLMPVTYGVASPAPYFIPPSKSGDASFSSSASQAGKPLTGGTKLTVPEKDYYVTAPAFSLKPTEKDGIRHIGPFNIEQSNSSPIPMETGRTITAAYPVKGVPGMDLTINMFAGHRETNTGSNVGTAALTAGMRIKW